MSGQLKNRQGLKIYS